MLPVHVSPKHKLVGVPFDEGNSTELTHLFPNAVKVGLSRGPHLLVPHRPTESFLLRRLGYDVPAPILSHYDWPCPDGEPPFDAQKKTAAMLTMNQRAYVLNSMGTGKTRAALWAWDYLRGNQLANKLLVIAPLSTLKFTWAREIFQLLPQCKVSVLHGEKKRRLARLNDSDTDIFVINHDGVKVILPELMAREDIDTIIIDELAVYRNGGTTRSKNLKRYAEKKHVTWCWGMTGSPIPTSPTDAWAQATIVTPANVPRYFSRFREALMVKVGTFKWVPKPDAVEQAFQALQPAVRFTLDDVYELPECITRPLEVDLGVKQGKVYRDLTAKFHAAVLSEQITAANAGALMSKLLQVACGWVYTSDHRIVELDNQARVSALVDNVLAADQKVLVFVPYKHALAGISKALDIEDISHAVVDGDTSMTKRSEIFSLFQTTDKYHALVAHPTCLSHGLTLTAADTIIWFSPVTSLETYEQANARISRVGQKHKQLVLHMQSTPVEKRVYSMLREHQKVQDKLLELFTLSTQQRQGAYSMREGKPIGPRINPQRIKGPTNTTTPITNAKVSLSKTAGEVLRNIAARINLKS